MNRQRGFKQKLAQISRLWDRQRYDVALAEVEGLLGQTRVSQQLDNKDEFRRCLLELLYLTRFDADSQQNGPPGEDVIFKSPSGHFYALQLRGRTRTKSTTF